MGNKIDYSFYDADFDDNDFTINSNDFLDTCQFCDENPCTCHDNVCCYDPHYTGEKGSCHCAEQQTEYERANHWFFKRWDVFYYEQWQSLRWRWLTHNPFSRAKSYLFGKRYCTECETKSLNRKWDGLICPNCGNESLPF